MNLAKPFGLTLQSGGINGDELVGERIELAANCGGISDPESLLATWNLQHRKQDRVCHLSGGLYRRLAVLRTHARIWVGKSNLHSMNPRRSRRKFRPNFGRTHLLTRTRELILNRRT